MASSYKFSLPTTAFSVNSYHYATKRYKTAAAKDYETKILYLLEPHVQLQTLAADWRKSGGYFTISICVVYPRHAFFNRHGAISSKTFDVDNVVKPLIDLIFGQFMDVNDKNVIKVESAKRPGNLQAIEIEVTLVPQLFEQN